MAYDKESFLAGLAVGRALWKPPRVIGGGSSFVFTIDTTTVNDLTFTFRLHGDTPGRIVMWGDGGFDGVPTDATATHTYATHGVYHVSVIGSYDNISFSAASDSSLIEVHTPLNLTAKTVTTLFDASSMFFNCRHLKRIPGGLFKRLGPRNYLLHNLHWCFYSCESLEEIPSGLFADVPISHEYGADSGYFRMDSAFANCKSLLTLPYGLFDNDGFTMPNGMHMDMMTSLFAGCSSLEAVPDYLFAKVGRLHNDGTIADYYTRATNCFANCTSLRIIGSHVFNPYTSQVNGTFRNTAIEEIPENLFADFVNPCDFSECFYRCTSLKSIPANLFSLVSPTGFVRCFYYDYSITGALPELWEQYPNIDGTGCFYACDQAINYGDVPNVWKQR